MKIKVPQKVKQATSKVFTGIKFAALLPIATTIVNAEAGKADTDSKAEQEALRKINSYKNKTEQVDTVLKVSKDFIKEQAIKDYQIQEDLELVPIDSVDAYYEQYTKELQRNGVQRQKPLSETGEQIKNSVKNEIKRENKGTSTQEIDPAVEQAVDESYTPGEKVTPEQMDDYIQDKKEKEIREKDLEYRQEKRLPDLYIPLKITTSIAGTDFGTKDLYPIYGLGAEYAGLFDKDRPTQFFVKGMITVSGKDGDQKVITPTTQQGQILFGIRNPSNFAKYPANPVISTISMGVGGNNISQSADLKSKGGLFFIVKTAYAEDAIGVILNGTIQIENNERKTTDLSGKYEIYYGFELPFGINTNLLAGYRLENNNTGYSGLIDNEFHTPYLGLGINKQDLSIAVPAVFLKFNTNPLNPESYMDANLSIVFKGGWSMEFGAEQNTLVEDLKITQFKFNVSKGFDGW